MSSMKAIVCVCLMGAALVCAVQASKSTTSSTSTIEESLKDFLKTDSKNGRSYTPGVGQPQGVVDPNYMNQIFAHKQPMELIHLVPILLLLAFIPLVLPLIIQLFAGVFTPMNFTHGKRKRDTTFHKEPHINKLLLQLIKTYGDSLDKYNNLV